MVACCYFGAHLGNGVDHKFSSRLTDGTPHSCSDLVYFTPFLPFTLLDKIILSPIPLPFSLRTKIFQVKIPISLCSCWTKNSEFNSKFAKIFKVKFSFWLRKNSLSLLTHSILLPLESKQCPLRLASVLACADSADEFRFWCRSESQIAQPSRRS